MGISDKNRKILWAKSGNMCAICRHTLVFEKNNSDSESVVGEECHIVSGAKKGPRSSNIFPSEKIDDVSNLILLCRVHHKKIDDQVENYTAELLQIIKINHEKWVREKLQEKKVKSGVKRVKKNIPDKYDRMNSGKQLLEIASGACGCYQHYSDNLSEEESLVIGCFIQKVIDWGDLSPSFDTLDRMQAESSISIDIKELESQGYWVFAASEMQLFIDKDGTESDFRVMHISVMQSNDSQIVYA